MSSAKRSSSSSGGWLGSSCTRVLRRCERSIGWTHHPSRRRIVAYRSHNARQVERDSMSIGIIIVDHGSRSSQSNELLHELVVRFSRMFMDPYPIVEPAHMELA